VVAIDNTADGVLVHPFGVESRLDVLLGMRHLVRRGR